jgi:hypothetical protein
MSEENLAAVADDAESTVESTENEQQSEAEETTAGKEAEAPDGQDKPDADSEGDNDDTTDKEKPKGKSRNRRYAERITQQSARIAELERKIEESQKAAPTVEKPKPKLDDFENVHDFEAALTEYAVETALSKYSKQTDEQRAKEAAANSQKERARAFQSKMEDAKTFIPDFDDVMDEAPDIPVAGHVQDLVIDSERAPELIYHFAQNPDKLADINQMEPVHAAREIGRLEATLVKPKPRTTSKAPPPVKPVKGSATAKVPLAEMSMKEYAAVRTKEIYGG